MKILYHIYEWEVFVLPMYSYRYRGRESIFDTMIYKLGTKKNIFRSIYGDARKNEYVRSHNLI